VHQKYREIVTQILFIAGILALTSIATAGAGEGLTVHVNNPILVAGSAYAEPAQIAP
jgi:hypothetical protein